MGVAAWSPAWPLRCSAPKGAVTARLTVSPNHVTVGRAPLPFADCSLDLVLCQLPYSFADRATALSEAYRILTGDGCLRPYVRQTLDRHPFYEETLHHVIQRRLGMSTIMDIFALGDEDALNGLLTNAGFQRVEIEAVSITARFSNPEGFLAAEIDLETAAVPSMQTLDLAGPQCHRRRY